jgi:hypothetical protein
MDITAIKAAKANDAIFLMFRVLLQKNAESDPSNSPLNISEPGGGKQCPDGPERGLRRRTRPPGPGVIPGG